MSKIILTIDTQADNFDLEVPDGMTGEMVRSWLGYIVTILLMQAEEEIQPNNIIPFPIDEVLDGLALLPSPDDLKLAKDILDSIKHQPPPTTGVYQRPDCQHYHLRQREHARLNDDGTVTVSTLFACRDCDHEFTEIKTMSAADYKKPLF